MQYSPVCKCPSVCARAHGPFIKRTFSSWLVFFYRYTQVLSLPTTWYPNNMAVYLFICFVCVCVCVVAENPFHASRPSRQQGQPVCRQSRKTKTKKQIHLMKEGKKREKWQFFVHFILGFVLFVVAWWCWPSFYTYSHGSFVHYTQTQHWSVVRCCCKNKRREEST